MEQELEFIGLVLKRLYFIGEEVNNLACFTSIVERMAMPSELHTSGGVFIIGTHIDICAN